MKVFIFTIISALVLYIGLIIFDTTTSREVLEQKIVLEKHFTPELSTYSNGIGVSSSGNAVTTVNYTHENEKYIILTHDLSAETTREIYHTIKVGYTVSIAKVIGGISGNILKSKIK